LSSYQRAGTGLPSGSVPIPPPAGQQEHAGSAGARENSQPLRGGTVVFGALVLATFAGLFLAQRIKHTPTSVQGFVLRPASISPTAPRLPGGTSRRPAARSASEEQLSFRIATNDEVTATIVSSSGDTVATLVKGLPWPRYLRLCLAWNGRLGAGRLPAGVAARRAGTGICPAEPVVTLPAGRVAPAGDYRVRVSLRHARRSVLSPSSFALVRATASFS
jgi:hypothetical protein